MAGGRAAGTTAARGPGPWTARQRAGRAADLLAHGPIAEQRIEQRPQGRVVDLAGEVLEEAFELVEVAVGGGQEAARVGLGALRARDRWRAPAGAPRGSARRALATRTSSPRSKRPASRSASRKARAEDRAGAVAQLDRQVGGARAGDLALLARAGEHAVELVARSARAWRPSGAPAPARGARGGGHRPMMYGGSDAAPDLGPPSGWPQGPGDGVRIPGLERRRRRRLERRLVPVVVAAGPPLRADRLGGVLRLPVQSPMHPLRRGQHAGDRLADRRDLRGRGAAGAARSRARPGRRAVAALARIRLAPRRPRRGAGGAGRGLPRRAARRRAPHPPGVDERPRLRRGAARAPRPAALELRGADGDRRRAAHRLRRRRAALGEPVGGRPPLRRRRIQPEGGARAAAAGRKC